MAITTSYPGVYIEEVPSRVRTIEGVATSITAFLGRALRGPTGTPATVTSVAEFERVHGRLWSHSTLGYAVQHFFDNGGAEALIVRIHNGATAAKATVPAGRPCIDRRKRRRLGQRPARAGAISRSRQQAVQSRGKGPRRRLQRNFSEIVDRSRRSALRRFDPGAGIAACAAGRRGARGCPAAQRRAGRRRRRLHRSHRHAFCRRRRRRRYHRRADPHGLRMLEQAGLFNLLCIPRRPNHQLSGGRHLGGDLPGDGGDLLRRERRSVAMRLLRGGDLSLAPVLPRDRYGWQRRSRWAGRERRSGRRAAPARVAAAGRADTRDRAVRAGTRVERAGASAAAARVGATRRPAPSSRPSTRRPSCRPACATRPRAPSSAYTWWLPASHAAVRAGSRTPPSSIRSRRSGWRPGARRKSARSPASIPAPAAPASRPTAATSACPQTERLRRAHPFAMRR